MDDLEERLERQAAPWMPEPGDRLIGRVLEIGERESRFGGTYPVVVIVTDDGEELVIHAYHAVLTGELAQQRPRPGDRIGIKYFGRDADRKYERYRVVVDRAPERRGGPDWGRYAGQAEAELAGGESASTDSNGISEARSPVKRHTFAGGVDDLACASCGWAAEHPVHGGRPA